MEKTLIYGHRGACGYEYENSMTSFKKAISKGADGLETDCWLIEEGEVVIHHDKAVQVTGQDPVNISKMSLDEIRNVKLPNGDGILTLEELFNEFANKKTVSGMPIQFSIDLQDIAVGPAIIPILEKFGIMDRTVLCGNATLILRRARKKSEKARLVASNLENMITSDNLEAGTKVSKLNLEAFNIHVDYYDAEIHEMLNSAGLKCFIWDLNTEEELKRIIPLQPDAIYTDFPDLAVKINK